MLPLELEAVGVGDPGTIVGLCPSLWANVDNGAVGVGDSDGSIDPPGLLVRSIEDGDNEEAEAIVLVLFCSSEVNGTRAVVPRVDKIGIETILLSVVVVTETKECRGCWSAESEIWTMLLVVVTNCDKWISLSDPVE